MSVTVGGTEVERLIVEDASDLAGACADRRIARIVIQEAGIPGPAGSSADLSSIVFVPPLSYDDATKTIEISAPPSVGQVLRWDGTAWAPFALPERRVEHREITEAEALAKEITLLHPVTDAQKILFDIASGGGPQFLNDDFFLVGDQVIRWAGGPLDGLIEAGDKVRVVYE